MDNQCEATITTAYRRMKLKPLAAASPAVQKLDLVFVQSKQLGETQKGGGGEVYRCICRWIAGGAFHHLTGRGGCVVSAAGIKHGGFHGDKVHKKETQK